MGLNESISEPTWQEKRRTSSQLGLGRFGWCTHTQPLALPVLPEEENVWGGGRTELFRGFSYLQLASAMAAMPPASSWLDSIISLHSVAIISYSKSSFPAPKFYCFEKMLGFT